MLRSKVLRRSGFTFQTFVNILPAFARYFVVLMCLTYFFALLGARWRRIAGALGARLMHERAGTGMELYAGLANPDNPAFESTAFASLGYWQNNFDNLVSGVASGPGRGAPSLMHRVQGRALVTLFEIMVVSEWCASWSAWPLI